MSLESRDTGSRRPATGDTHADRAAPRLAGEPGPECRMKWMKTEDPEFRVPVPAPEAFGGWPFYFLVHPIYCFYFTLGAPLLPGAGIGTLGRTWNLGTWALPFLPSARESPKFRGSGSASRFRAPFRNLGTRRLGFHWELEAGAGIPMWSLERAWGSQFRNSENGIAVPLLHCRYTCVARLSGPGRPRSPRT